MTLHEAAGSSLQAIKSVRSKENVERSPIYPPKVHLTTFNSHLVLISPSNSKNRSELPLSLI